MSRVVEPLRLLLAVSNTVIREGLVLLLERSPEPVRVLSTGAPPGPEQPELILFDIHQDPERLRHAWPEAVLVLLDSGSATRDINYLLVCHQVRGVIAPDSTVAMFYKALRVVRNGEIWIDQQHLKALLTNLGTLSAGGGIRELSAQDRRIILLICRGARNQEIAEELCLSEHTIKSHVSRIYRRLHVKNRAQLASLARNARFPDAEMPD